MKFMLFVPELWVICGCLLLFLGCLGSGSGRASRMMAAVVSIVAVILTAFSLYQHGSLFFEAYRVDLFSQLFKFMVAAGLTVVILFDREVNSVGE